MNTTIRRTCVMDQCVSFRVRNDPQAVWDGRTETTPSRIDSSRPSTSRACWSGHCLWVSVGTACTTPPWGDVPPNWTQVGTLTNTWPLPSKRYQILKCSVLYCLHRQFAATWFNMYDFTVFDPVEVSALMISVFIHCFHWRTDQSFYVPLRSRLIGKMETILTS